MGAMLNSSDASITSIRPPAGHATEDTFVSKHHSERLMAAYAGDKNFITFRGDHNSVRCPVCFDGVFSCSFVMLNAQFTMH